MQAFSFNPKDALNSLKKLPKKLKNITTKIFNERAAPREEINFQWPDLENQKTTKKEDKGGNAMQLSRKYKFRTTANPNATKETSNGGPQKGWVKYNWDIEHTRMSTNKRSETNRKSTEPRKFIINTLITDYT